MHDGPCSRWWVGFLQTIASLPKHDQFFWLASSQLKFFFCRKRNAFLNVSASYLHTKASYFFPLQCSISSLEEETFSSIRRPKTPSSSDCSNLNTQTNWAKSLPLPTPEEKMRQQAQTVQADVVPINITGMLLCTQVPGVWGGWRGSLSVPWS